MNGALKMLALFVLLAEPLAASATVIQGVFAGEVSSGTDQNGSAFGGVERLSFLPIAGRFWYDTDLAPSDYCATPVDGCYDYLVSTDIWMQIVITINGVDLAISNLDGLGDAGGGAYTEQARVTPAPGFEGSGDRWSIVDFDRAGGSTPTQMSRAYLYVVGAQLFDDDRLSNTFSWTSNGQSDFGYGQFDYFSTAGIQTSASFNLTSVSMHALSVPEPGTLALFGLGLAGLGFARRRTST